MVRGYQKGQPDAFLQGDGLFISHGDPHQPIWTYAAGYGDHKNAATTLFLIVTWPVKIGHAGS